MKWIAYIITIFTLLVAIIFTACENTEEVHDMDHNYYTADDYKMLKTALNIPNQSINYTIDLPAHVGGKSPFISNDMSLLGRVLFYDKNLSQNRTISCASCHKQEIAFSDNTAFSINLLTSSGTNKRPTILESI